LTLALLNTIGVDAATIPAASIPLPAILRAPALLHVYWARRTWHAGFAGCGS
jgi:hypothetical protein